MASHAAGGRTKSPTGLLLPFQDFHFDSPMFLDDPFYGLGLPITDRKYHCQTRVGHTDQYGQHVSAFGIREVPTGSGEEEEEEDLLTVNKE